MNILIIGCGPGDNDSLAETIDNKKHKLTYALSTNKAFEMLSKIDFGLIITGTAIPEMSCVDFIIFIREEFKHPPIPILVISNTTGTEFITMILKNGANAFVSSPLNSQVLSRIIKDLKQ